MPLSQPDRSRSGSDNGMTLGMLSAIASNTSLIVSIARLAPMQ